MIMFKRLASLAKPFSISHRHFQVSITGAARPLGQTASLLLKQNPLIHRLNMIDNREEIKGIALDVSQIPQRASVASWKDNIEKPLSNSDVIVVANGEQRKAGQDDSKLFKENAEAIVSIMQKIASHCPKAFVIIATEPINLIVPLASAVLQSKGFKNKNKILGVTSQDTMRAQCWISELSGLPSNSITIPVICGHSANTIVPLFSQIIPKIDISEGTAALITKQLRKSENFIADSNIYWGKHSLISAYAISSTVSAVLNALNGVDSQHVAFVAHNRYGTEYFSNPALITSEGVSGIMQYDITSNENNLLANATHQLTREISEGEAYFNPSFTFTDFQKIFRNDNVHF